MSSKHAAGRARGCGRPREQATTARQKGLPSDAKRASSDEEVEAAEAKEDDARRLVVLLLLPPPTPPPVPPSFCGGHGALYALRNPSRTRGSGGGSRPWSAA